MAQLFGEVIQNNEFGTHHTVGFRVCIAENLLAGGELHAEPFDDGFDDLVDEFRFVWLDGFFAEFGRRLGGSACLGNLVATLDLVVEKRPIL